MTLPCRAERHGRCAGEFLPPLYLTARPKPQPCGCMCHVHDLLEHEGRLR